MLALTRKKDEAIIINGSIKIQVLDIIDGKVKLGIEAPREMSIHRQEIYLEIEQNNKNAIESHQVTAQQLAQMIKNK